METATEVKVQSSKPSKGVVPVIDRISFDLGNRVNALTDGDKIVHFPSYSDRLSAKQDLDFGLPDFVERRSFRVDIGAQSFKVGAIAGLLTAKPTFSGDKWAKAKEFLFAGLAALGIEENAHIKELRCSVPDDQDLAQRTPFELLANTAHQFKINGHEYTVQIDAVQIAAEGKFAWLQACRDGLLMYPQYLNGVLDLGGGTAIARLIAPDGTIARDFEKVLQGGTSQLAAQIAAECSLTGVEGQIMDAIADGTFCVHAINFKNIYDALLPEWVEGIRAEMNKAWKPIQDQYAQILIVGGSAPIFAPFVDGNPRYVVAPNPQFYGLEAMQSNG
ncbi:MAG: hypothetical protein AAFY26_08260 [Cyanobacteria bacterium J06638_22]